MSILKQISKRKIIYTSIALFITSTASAAIPIIPILFWGIVAGAATSTGLGIYCVASDACSSSSKKKDKLNSTTTSKTPATTTSKTPATTTSKTPATTTTPQFIQPQIPITAVGCTVLVRPHAISVLISQAANEQIEVNIQNIEAMDTDHREEAIVRTLKELRTNACYLHSLVGRTVPLASLENNAPNIPEYSETIFRSTGILNRMLIAQRRLSQLFGERQWTTSINSEMTSISNYLTRSYSEVTNYLHQRFPRTLNFEITQRATPALINFRNDLLANRLDALTDFFAHNALRIARTRYQQGLATGEIISDEVQGGFTVRINTMLDNTDAGLINILRSHARPLLENQTRARLADWQSVQNTLEEVVTDTYDQVFSRITCINTVATAALHQTCRENNVHRYSSELNK
ncbi:hypothetical protein QEJ31_07190 [Pigmentibacter sp. JX0631]|uniref:hypothetical protein n=1 Tax=Pigmentibacter sp. JX0631 TaxID=2976982 RepID=UPI002468CCD8|nr:hypothetical protein [Pigmentibacter sp. JX0631]WGL61375.1 hypothetical protein QEJ31_07190 [Pigmentibacter sp. JX0631]